MPLRLARRGCSKQSIHILLGMDATRGRQRHAHLNGVRGRWYLWAFPEQIKPDRRISEAKLTDSWKREKCKVKGTEEQGSANGVTPTGLQAVAPKKGLCGADCPLYDRAGCTLCGSGVLS